MPGDRLEQISDSVFTINRQRPDDYQSVIRLLKEKGAAPDAILHTWSENSLNWKKHSNQEFIPCFI